jgi:hypothetical protein
MSRPLDILGARAVKELHAGTIKEASPDGTCTYVLGDQDDRVRGPARYLRPAQPTVATTEGDLAHDHDRPAPPPEGTPCLVVIIGGDFANAWVIPFE